MVSKKYQSESFPLEVDFCITKFSVEMRTAMKVVTNGETIEWYKVSLENGKISEAKIKAEAINFFDLSAEDKNKDKRYFKRNLEDLVKSHKKVETNLVREILKAKHGHGKNHENPPKDFLQEVDCEKTRRLQFLKTARDEMKYSLKYKDWCSKEFRLFASHNETLVKKLNQEQSNVSQLMKESEGIKLVRERSTGSNIFDAERQVFSKNPCSSCCFHPGESLLRSLIFFVQRDSCVFPPLLLLPASLFTNAAPQFLLSQLKMQR